MKKKFKPECIYCGHKYTSAKDYFTHSCEVGYVSWKQRYQQTPRKKKFKIKSLDLVK